MIRDRVKITKASHSFGAFCCIHIYSFFLCETTTSGESLVTLEPYVRRVVTHLRVVLNSSWIVVSLLNERENDAAYISIYVCVFGRNFKEYIAFRFRTSSNRLAL